jgi:uncharacterized protein YpmS
MRKEGSIHFGLIFLILLVLLVIITFVLSLIKVPYQTTEKYTDQEPYEEIEFYNETVTEQTQVPYTIQETYTVNVSQKAPEPGTLGQRLLPVDERQSEAPRTMFRRETCRDVPIDYTITYLKSTLPDMAYDASIPAGFLKTGGYMNTELTIQAKICNNERMRMKTDFAMCYYDKGVEVECPSKLIFTIYAGSCKTEELRWLTPVSQTKDIRLKEASPMVRTICEPVRSGLTAVSSINTEQRTRDVTEYRTETVEKTEQMNRTITKYRDVIKERPATAYRSLLKDILVKFGLMHQAL